MSSTVFYGGPFIRRTTINSSGGTLVGLCVGFLIDHSVSVGFAAYGLASDIIASQETRQSFPGRYLEMELMYGGMELGYSYQPHKLVHVAVSALAGAGNFGFKDESTGDPEFDFERMDTFFFLEPSLTAVLNVTSWLRFETGLSYREVGDLKLRGVGDDDINGLSYDLSVKFGLF